MNWYPLHLLSKQSCLQTLKYKIHLYVALAVSRPLELIKLIIISLRDEVVKVRLLDGELR